MTENKFNIGLIGFGYWGKILYRYFRDHPGFRVKSIATRHPAMIREEVPEAVDVCLPKKLIADREIDAVVVASPIPSHYGLIMEALGAGKHVFAEKPLTVKYNEAMDIAKLAGKQGLMVFTDYIFTFSPAVLKMIELMKDGAIGRVTGAVFHVRQLGHFSRHSVYVDLACHLLAVLDMITPLDNLRFNRLDLVTRNGFVETGLLDFTSRAVPFDLNGKAEQAGRSNHGCRWREEMVTDKLKAGGIFISFNHPGKVRNLTLYGDRGTLVYDMMEEKPLKLLNYRVDRDRSRDASEKSLTEFAFDEFNTVKEVVNGFHRVLTGEAPSNLDMSLRVTRVLEEIEETSE